ncbi:alpha/beta hydrolase [Gordonia sp. NPDC003424]
MAVTIPAQPGPTVEVNGSPASAESMATRLVNAANSVESQQDFATGEAIRGVGAGGGTWSGKAATAYLGAIAPFSSETSTAYTGLSRGARALRSYGDRLTELQRTHHELWSQRGELSTAITNFAAEVGSWDGKEIPADTLSDLQARSTALAEQVRLFDEANARLAAATAANERALVSELAKYGDITASERSLKDQGYDPAQQIRTALDKAHRGAHPQDLAHLSAEDRARWWASLTPAEREAVEQEFPEYLGNGQGLPASVRDVANRQNLDRDIAQSQAIVTLGDLNGGRYRDAQKTLRNARYVKAGLDHAEQVAPGSVVQLYAYDPRAFGGDGKAVVSIGDLDTARNVAWNVPGMTTDISKTDGNVRSAADLYNQAGGKRNSVASVAWIGYDAPSGADVGSVAGPGAAQEGGRLLAEDIQGFTAARDQLGLGQGEGAGDHLDLNLIGHSYGSTTVGWAGDAGRLADDLDTVTLLGSPGAGGVATAGEFGVGQQNVYVGAASNDLVGHLGATSVPITGASGLGIDPATTAFGGERFRAEGGDATLVIGNHNSYYQTGTESLDNLGKIVSGNGEDITHENRRSVHDVIDGWLSAGHSDPAVDSRRAGK